MSITIFIGCFFAYALICACVYSYLHRASGAPSLNEYGMAEAQGGMIFSFYGLWLSARYNRWNAAHLQRLMEIERQKLQLEKATNSTAYRLLLNSYKPALSDIGLASESLTDAVVERHIIHQRTNEQAQFSHALNQYKAFGVCSLCSAFWFYAPLYAGALWGLYANDLISTDNCILHAFIGLCFPPVGFFMQQKIVE